MTKPPKDVVVAIAGAFAILSLGGLATDIGPWYSALKKPPWQPPDWLFGPVWTTIYTLVAIAGVRGWRRARNVREQRSLVLLFTANAIVNVLWSVLFFRLGHPDWSLLEVGVLWSSVLSLVILLWRRDAVGGLLMVPYLSWVSFASILNLAIVVRNVPFATR